MKNFKTILCLILAVLMLFAFAACGKDETNPEQEITPGDIYEYAEEDNNTSIDGDITDLEELIGSEISLPSDFQVTRYAIVEESMAQIEFTYKELKGTGRYAKGQFSNMSGLTRSFTNDETVDMDGVSARLRYNHYEEGTLEAVTGGGKSSVGVADAYSAANDMSYMIFFTSGADKENLTSALKEFMAAVGSDAMEDAAEEAGEDLVK